ncbi:hypothetical protein MRX96_054313 [Rhipicephalus microplus]
MKKAKRCRKSNKTQSVDCHGYVNPLELVLDTSKEENAREVARAGPLEVPSSHSWDRWPRLLRCSSTTLLPSMGGPSVAGGHMAAMSPGVAATGQTMPLLPTNMVASSDAGAGKKQLSRTPTQPPPGTIEYAVKASDTLAGIGARFECTPGELTTINRLTSRLIFPGQTLYIPVNKQESQAADVADVREHRLEDDKASVGNHGTGAGLPLPGGRPCSPKATASPPGSPAAFMEQQRHRCSANEHIESAESENKDNMDMFLNISSRHITDGQGVVMGTLLVTPNNVMFVPNVSDPLVMEHGSECYEVTAPMDMVVAAAIYNDITHMHVRDTPDAAAECKPPKEVHDTFSADTVVKSNSLEQGQQQDTKQTLLLESDVQKPEAVVESTEQSDAQLKSSDKFTSKKGPYSEPHNEEVCALQANKYSSLEATTTLLGKVESGVRSSAAKKLAADVGPVPDACEKTAKASAEVSKQLEAAAGEAGTGESNNVVPLVTQLEVELSSATVQVVKDDRAGDKLATKHIETLTNLQERLPTDSATPQKILAMEESAAAKEIERETADEYLLKPINRASESQPTVRGEPNSGGCWGKGSTLPPLSLGGKSLPEPLCLSCMPSSTLELSSTNHVPATELSSVASTESIPVCMREWASADDGVPSDRSQEPAHEQVLKELSSPVELISLSTHSISKTIASSPKLEANFLHSADDPVPLTPTLQLQTQQLAADEKRPSLQTGNANVWLKNMVEEKPELFAAFDKLVPRLAQSSEATLLYLCLRMGRPLHKNQCSATASSKRCIRSQYWFGIPRNRADELYYFLEKWAPSVYGDVHRVDMASRGFRAITRACG